MRTPARIAGHPIHPMLVPLPIGLWAFSFVCDLAFLATGSASWAQVSFYALGGGIVGAALAAIPGLIDGWSVERGDVFRNVLAHMALNALALVVFVVSFLSRSIEAPFSFSVAASAIGILVVALGGWFGGELVFVLGVGVDEAEARRAERGEDARRSA
jgi:uncharacterized membrane protein